MELVFDTVAPRTLTFQNKLLSLRGRVQVFDPAQAMVYEARGEFAFFLPTWHLHAGEHEIATIRRRIFAWRPTWDVRLATESLVVYRKLLSWRRRYFVLGGGTTERRSREASWT